MATLPFVQKVVGFEPFSQKVADSRLVQPLLLVEKLRHGVGSPFQKVVFHQVLDALQGKGAET